MRYSLSGVQSWKILEIKDFSGVKRLKSAGLSQTKSDGGGAVPTAHRKPIPAKRIPFIFLRAAQGRDVPIAIRSLAILSEAKGMAHHSSLNRSHFCSPCAVSVKTLIVVLTGDHSIHRQTRQAPNANEPPQQPTAITRPMSAKKA
jgi:hypothetical protein